MTYNKFALVRRDKIAAASNNSEEWELAYHHDGLPVIGDKREELEQTGAEWAEHVDGDEYEYKVVPVAIEYQAE